MPEAFDPYSEWLGLPAGPRPPSHYALLALSPGESDPTAISQAADAQRARIRRIRPGQYLADWSRLLDQIAAVKVCLLDPASKAAYDSSLMNPAPAYSVPATSPTPTPYSTPAPIPYTAPAPTPTPYASPSSPAAQQPWGGLPPSASPILQARAVTLTAWASAPTPIGVDSVQPPSAPAWEGPAGVAPTAPGGAFSTTPGQSRAAASKRFLVSVILGLLLVLVASLGVTLYVLFRQPQEPTANGNGSGGAGAETSKQSGATGTGAKTAEVAKEQKTSAKSPNGSEKTAPAAKAVDPVPPTKPDPQEKPDPAEKPQPTSPERPQPQDDAQKRAAFNRAVAEARGAMYDRDLAGARQHVKVARDAAQSPADQEVAARLDSLQQNLEEFWKGIRGTIAKIEAPGELPVGNDNYVSVVDNTPQQIILKVQGEIRRYPMDNLPKWLINWALGRMSLNAPPAKVILGAYHAMDRDGDRARARQLWQEAARAGLKVDLLLPELDVPISGGGKKPGARPVGPASEEKVADLERRLGEAQTAGNHKDVAVEALVMLEQAMAAKNMDYAARLAELAFTAARKSNSPVLMKQATAARQMVEARRKQK